MKILLSVIMLCALCANADALPANQMPASLKSEPHQRDPYNWEARHQSIIQHHKAEKPDYVMIGDSITHRFGTSILPDSMPLHGEKAWKKLFGTHKATNMGFGFDYIDNAFYRVENGELDGCNPRVIVLLLGTNNLGHRKDTAQVCGDNMKAFVALLKEKCPQSKILILGVLPRKEENLVVPIKDTNRLYKKLADNKTVFFFDVGKKLLQENSDFPKPEYMADTVHVSQSAYSLIADELAKVFKKIDSQY